MERYGLVRFVKGAGRQLAPRVHYSDIVLDMPLKRPSASRRAVGDF
jgi:predicted transcriptional regulator